MYISVGVMFMPFTAITLFHAIENASAKASDKQQSCEKASFENR